jgi:hypothetical protein
MIMYGHNTFSKAYHLVDVLGKTGSWCIELPSHLGDETLTGNGLNDLLHTLATLNHIHTMTREPGSHTPTLKVKFTRKRGVKLGCTLYYKVGDYLNADDIPKVTIRTQAEREQFLMHLFNRMQEAIEGDMLGQPKFCNDRHAADTKERLYEFSLYLKLNTTERNEITKMMRLKSMCYRYNAISAAYPDNAYGRIEDEGRYIYPQEHKHYSKKPTIVM